MTGCTNTFPPDKIDPTGNMTREDYQALRERDPTKQPKEKGDAANPEPLFPPISASALAAPVSPVAPQRPTTQKLVSLSVTDSVPLRDVLMELARETKQSLELDPRIKGGIIFSAHEQPYELVLKRICQLAGLRYRMEGDFLRIELDEPYQASYSVDYPSLARRTTSEVSIATNVFDVDVAQGSSNSQSRNSSNSGDNNSISRVEALSEANFWTELEVSLKQILANGSRNPQSNISTTDPAAPTSYSLDRQAGLVTIFANSRQQEAVQDYLRRVQHKATAQVLIEARIVEVELSDKFQSGINWRTLFDDAFNAAARFGTVGAGAPFNLATTAADGVFTASVKENDFSAILNLVRTFGTTRILSAPRLTVLNNQTAVLKVARNEVYFVTSAQYPTTVSTAGVPVSGTPVFSSTPRTVPVGLVMTVQPSIDQQKERITLTLRPTISRVVDRVDDPSIGLNAAQSGVSTPVRSQIPVLAVRELDSVLQMQSGEVAVMGGLMQDSSVNQDQGIPPFDTLPVVGNLAKSRDNNGQTSELIILLRAIILRNPAPDVADVDLYRRYNNDPRPLPLPFPPEVISPPTD